MGGTGFVMATTPEALTTRNLANGNQKQNHPGTYMGNLLKKLFIFPIRLYQWTLSPWLVSNCRHVASCSQYAVEAIQEWGPIKGIWLGMKRIARCHPWGTSGYDPVPRRSDRKS